MGCVPLMEKGGGPSSATTRGAVAGSPTRSRKGGRGLPPPHVRRGPETLDEVSRVLPIDDDVLRHMATRRLEWRPYRSRSGRRRDGRRCRDPADALEEEVAMVSINRVVLVGNLTPPPRAATHAVRHGRWLQPPTRGQHAAQGRDRPVGRQAELLRHHGVGTPGGARSRPVPLEGPPVGDRRPPRGRREWETPEGNRSAKRSGAVPTRCSSSGAGGEGGAASGGGYIPS